MMTARLMMARLMAARRPGIRTLLAGAASVSLVLVAMLSPDAARVQADDVFASLRAPGETGFIAGHRGDLEGAPENTLPAFQRTIDSDADFLEADLQLTSDGVPVLMHDWMLDRTTDGTGPVWAMPWAELRRLDAGSWYSPAYAGTRVPTLSQLLDLLRSSTKGALLELKGSWNQEQLRDLAAEVRRFGVESRVMFASFDIMSLRALASVAPQFPRLVVTRELVGDPILLAATCGAVAIVTSQAFVARDPGAVSRIHEAGLGVLVYTLNSEENWSAAISLGVDGIITDRPAALAEWLDGD